MQGAIQVLCFTFLLYGDYDFDDDDDDHYYAVSQKRARFNFAVTWPKIMRFPKFLTYIEKYEICLLLSLLLLLLPEAQSRLQSWGSGSSSLV